MRAASASMSMPSRSATACATAAPNVQHTTRSAVLEASCKGRTTQQACQGHRRTTRTHARMAPRTPYSASRSHKPTRSRAKGVPQVRASVCKRVEHNHTRRPAVRPGSRAACAHQPRSRRAGRLACFVRRNVTSVPVSVRTRCSTPPTSASRRAITSGPKRSCGGWRRGRWREDGGSGLGCSSY
jgi:hypothetical protein